MDSDNAKLTALPKPQPGQAGRRKLAIMAVLALMLLTGMTFWLTRDEEAQKDITAKAEDTLRSAGLNPLINATKDLLAPPPPPPPVHSVGVAAPGIPASGTLILGSLPAPEVLTAAANAQNTGTPTTNREIHENANIAQPAPLPGVMPQQREDSVIRPDFVNDLASWLVARYKPAPHGGKGQINVGIQAANMRYGLNMHGMERQSKDPAAARARILRYAFNPAMLEALYGIYAVRLVDDVARVALAPDQGKALNETQLDDLYKSYAAFLADLAGVTNGIAATSDLKERVDTVNSANQRTIDLHRQITENVFALDESREKNNDASIPGIQARIDNLNERYRASLQGQNNARAALISTIRNNGGAPTPRLDDDSVLFLALWVERLMDKQTDALDAVRKAAALLTDLSRRFENAASASQKQAGTR